MLQALCDTYADSRYLLSWESSRGKLLMEEASSAEDVLLAVWQVRSDRAGLIADIKNYMQSCAFSYMIGSLVKEALM